MRSLNTSVLYQAKNNYWEKLKKTKPELIWSFQSSKKYTIQHILFSSVRIMKNKVRDYLMVKLKTNWTSLKSMSDKRTLLSII